MIQSMVSLIESLSSEESESHKVYQRLVSVGRSLSLERCVWVISQLPEIVLFCLLGNAQIQLDESQERILDKHRAIYKGIALHLDSLILHNPRHPNLKDFKYEESLAKLSASVLKMASAMNRSDHWLLRHYFVIPKLFWLRCEFTLCRESFKNDGLLASLGLDADIPTLVGKKEYRESSKQLFKQLDPIVPYNESAFRQAVGYEECSKEEMDNYVWNNPLNYLTAEGYLRAKGDDDFCIDFFQPYQRAWASIRNLTTSSNIQFSVLDTFGDILTTEAHTNRRNRKKPQRKVL